MERKMEVLRASRMVEVTMEEVPWAVEGAEGMGHEVEGVPMEIVEGIEVLGMRMETEEISHQTLL